MVKTWWSYGAMPWIHQGICTFDIQWWYKSIIVISLVLRIHRCSAQTEVIVQWWLSLRSDSTVEEKAANERVSDHSILGYSISSVLIIIYIGLSPWPKRQQEGDWLGLPFGCLPLWLGWCYLYIFSCMFKLYAIYASHRVRPVGYMDSLRSLLPILVLTNLGRTLLGEKGTKSHVCLRSTRTLGWSTFLFY
jgi:hypothetical protein